MNLEKAFHTLCDAGVGFVVIGGIAAVLHESAYVTFDLDICYSRIPPSLKRLKQALLPFHPRPRGFPPEPRFVWDETTLRNRSVITLQTDMTAYQTCAILQLRHNFFLNSEKQALLLGDLDLLAEVDGLGTYDAVNDHSRIVLAFDRRIAVVNIRGLIRAKRAVGRAKDLSILPELEA
jgi:hypothetical protein